MENRGKKATRSAKVPSGEPSEDESAAKRRRTDVPREEDQGSGMPSISAEEFREGVEVMRRATAMLAKLQNKEAGDADVSGSAESGRSSWTC